MSTSGLSHDEVLIEVCGALQHPIRRWVLDQAVAKGSVTSADVIRQFPYLLPSGGTVYLRPLLELKLLRFAKRGSTCTTYAVGDLTPLRALHDYLGALLSPTKEVPRETNR